MRVQPATSRIAELAGAATGGSIQAAELAQAMATGAVIANITSGATGYDLGAGECLRRAGLAAEEHRVRQRESLCGARQADAGRCCKAGAEAETRGWKVSEEKTKWYLEQLAKNGMTVTPPSPRSPREVEEDRRHDDFRVDEAGWTGQAVVDAYRKM